MSYRYIRIIEHWVIAGGPYFISFVEFCAHDCVLLFKYSCLLCDKNDQFKLVDDIHMLCDAFVLLQFVFQCLILLFFLNNS